MLLCERRGVLALLIRLALTSAQAARTLYFAVTTPQTRGARALCLTREDRVVLVRQSYTKGWFLPGGAIKGGEQVATGLVRELREEIGLTSHGQAEALFDISHRPSHKHDTQSLILLRDVDLSPSLSLEIEAIGLFSLADLPSNTHPSTRYKIERILSVLAGDGRDWTGVPIPAET